jgi:Flp pilus assembly protein TadB
MKLTKAGRFMITLATCIAVSGLVTGQKLQSLLAGIILIVGLILLWLAKRAKRE